MFRKNTFFKGAVLLAVIFTTLQGCEGIGPEQESAASGKEDLSKIMVDGDNILYADMSEYDLRASTKSADDNFRHMVSLESLLEHGKSVVVNDADGHWVMTPIRETSSSRAYLTNERVDDTEGLSDDDASGIKKFLIESPSAYFVVTMIPYCCVEDNGWDYFHKDGFFGQIIFSSASGDLLCMENHHPFLGLHDTYPVTYKNKMDGESVEWIIVEGPARTRVMGGQLNQAVCTARKSDDWDWTEYIPRYYSSRDDKLKEDITNSGGGGGGSKKQPSVLTCTLTLEKSGGGNGDVYTSGSYGSETIVNVRAIPDRKSTFFYWTGDIVSDQPYVTIKMSKNTKATAVFGGEDETKPCYNGEKESFFPIGGDVEIAPTSEGGRASSGTYGDVRYFKDGNKKAHRGWDIEAEPGTPFYAPVTGVINSNIVSNIHNGTKGSSETGNRIGITFTQNGHSYAVFFMHLNYTDPKNPDAEDNGIGINPMTGETWKAGDVITAGQMLGRSGATGCAHDVDCKHLHVQIHTDPTKWPVTGSQDPWLWNQYEEPTMLFGDVLTTDGNGNVTGYKINPKCTELPKSDNQTGINGIMNEESWNVALYPGRN